MPLTRPSSQLKPYAGMTAYAGDLHNHCGISYGHGSIEEAFANARQQLDFASVTGHAHWHDIPSEPKGVHDYHIEGFARLKSQWDHVQDVTASSHCDNEFVTFISFEWHSLAYGDHCVYFRSDHAPLEIAQANSLEELRSRLRKFTAGGIPAMALPHHIGYKAGHRGINWLTYTEEFAPVVELVSMHGSGEDEPGPRAYLHTMGPRDGASTAQHGLAIGHKFGFIGSTDHHSAHPGSYGYGKAMVWANELTREGIWEAIAARRTYAVTGDRIMLATSVNGAPMGSEITGSGIRTIELEVLGGDRIDYVELLRNNVVIARESPTPLDETQFDGVVAISVGWGEHGVLVPWDIEISVLDGEIVSVDPRLHGEDVVDPTRKESNTTDQSVSQWRHVDERTVTLTTQTRGNSTVMTDGTQQLGLHVIGNENTTLEVRFNGCRVQRTVAELRKGSHTEYTAGFLSPAILLHRAVDHSMRALQISVEDAGSGNDSDWYYARVRQVNDQYAWSSPTWVNEER